MHLPPAVTSLLRKALSPPYHAHLFPTPTTTPHLPSTTSPILATISTTTDTHNVQHSFNILLTTNQIIHQTLFGEGILLPQTHAPQVHFRFVRDLANPRSLEIYQLPANDSFLLTFSQHTNQTQFTSVKALFRRSLFLNILLQQQQQLQLHHQQQQHINTHAFSTALLSFTTNISTRATPSPAHKQSHHHLFPPPFTTTNSPLMTDLQATCGHFDVQSIKQSATPAHPNNQTQQQYTFRTHFTLPTHLAPTSQPDLLHNLTSPLQTTVPQPSSTLHHDDIDPLTYQTFGDHSLVEFTEDFFAAADPTVLIYEQLSHNFEFIDSLGLPPPVLPSGDIAASVHASNFARSSPISEGFAYIPSSPSPAGEPISTRPFSSPSQNSFIQVASSAPEALSLPHPSVQSPGGNQHSSSRSASPIQASPSHSERDDPNEVAQKLKAEIRKERNRASALRSNMRKRAIRDTTKMELRHCQEKIKLLRSREVLLRRENMRMRKLISEDSSIVNKLLANIMVKNRP